MILPLTMALPDLIKVSASLLEHIPELEIYLFNLMPFESVGFLTSEGAFLKDLTFSGCGLKFLSFDFPDLGLEEELDEDDFALLSLLSELRSCRPLDELFFAVIRNFFAKVRNHLNK